MKDLAKKVYAKMTSHANYSQMNGIEKDWFLKCIEDGLIEAQQQVNSVDLADVGGSLPSANDIQEEAERYRIKSVCNSSEARISFAQGALWMRGKIDKQ